MASGKEKDRDTPSTDTEHTVHDHPVPPEGLGRYSPIRDADSEQDIANYVHGQAHDEEVQHVEKIKTEYVLGTGYDMWDVTTDKNRWWVITNMTNLYSQQHFPSLDYTLSFHVGLMMRLRSRSDRDEREPDPFDEVFRRQEQAHDGLDRAVEAEDFQAVGMHLRESLISLMDTVRRRVDLSGIVDYPQAANFKAWAELLIGILCPGSSSKELRKFLKSYADDVWQLVNWVTHHRGATEATASIAAHSTDTLTGHFIQLVTRAASGDIDECPRCKSRNIRSHFDIEIEPDGAYYGTCGACGWSNHPSDGE